MIKRNTVIITGAGANNDYGFPTGNELKQEIIDNYLTLYEKHTNPFDFGSYHTFDELDNSMREVFLQPRKEFIKKFEEANIQIDRFIAMNESNLEFEEFAKEAIVLNLLDNEHKNVVRGKWLEELYQQMVSGCSKSSEYEKIKDNKISFITFNYDRVIEQFLFTRTSQWYQIEDEEKLKKAIQDIQVINVFGHIANLLWQQEPTMGYGGYNGQHLGHSYKLLTKNIELIREKNDIQVIKSYNEIQNVLEKAERLYILGFAFNKYNIDALNFPDSIKNVEEVYITSKNLAKNRCEKIFENQDTINFEYESCEKLLKECILDEPHR